MFKQNTTKFFFIHYPTASVIALLQGLTQKSIEILCIQELLDVETLRGVKHSYRNIWRRRNIVLVVQLTDHRLPCSVDARIVLYVCRLYRSIQLHIYTAVVAQWVVESLLYQLDAKTVLDVNRYGHSIQVQICMAFSYEVICRYMEYIQRSRFSIGISPVPDHLLRTPACSKILAEYLKQCNIRQMLAMQSRFFTRILPSNFNE